MAIAYRALAGMDYPPDRRAEVGDVVTDLPSKSIKWLLEQGYIEPADKTADPAPADPAPADEAPVDAPADPAPATDGGES